VRWRRFKDSRIDIPTLISSTGGAESETLIVSPMPSANKIAKAVEDLIVPFDESLLKAYTVGKLKGKEAIGNIPKIKEELIYPELQNNFGKFEPDL
jgi:hypothetical protein